MKKCNEDKVSSSKIKQIIIHVINVQKKLMFSRILSHTTVVNININIIFMTVNIIETTI